MDFETLPPEITSALIHSGPGAGSLVEASGAWHRLGTELEYSATSYGSMLSSLNSTWHGPSSTAMVQAAAPYLAWLHATAQQCQQIAAAAQTAAAAFNSARSTMIPPAQVSANRTRLAQLVATNRFGINLPAIAETEAQYEGMWVNNSAAMNRYATTAAGAVALPQFTSPPAIVNPAGVAAQASAVPAAAAAASPAASVLPPFIPSLSATDWFLLANTWGNQFISSGFPINLVNLFSQFSQAQAQQGLQGLGAGLNELGGGIAEGAAATAASEASLASAVSAAGRAPMASLGAGVSVGRLTAPPAVVGLLPASQSPVRLASAVSPLSSGESGLPFLPPVMAPPLSLGSGWRKRRKQEDVEYGVEFRGTVMHRPPSGG